MGPAYRIVSKRLVLRCFSPTDAAEVQDLIARSRAHLENWVPLPPPSEPLEGMIQRLRDLRSRFDSDRDLSYAMVARDTAEIIGVGSLDLTEDPHSRSVGGWLRPDRIATGLGSEAAAAMVRVGFHVMGMQHMELRAEPKNPIACKLAVGLGFRTDGMVRPLSWVNEIRRDQLTFVLSAADYSGSPAAAVAVQAFDAIDRRVL